MGFANPTNVCVWCSCLILNENIKFIFSFAIYTVKNELSVVGILWTAIGYF